MKVTEIRGHHVGFAPSPAIGNARTMIRRRDFLLLEIVTDTGKRGWGEVFSSPDAAAALIRTRFAPVVLGQSPARYRALWERMAGNLGYPAAPVNACTQGPSCRGVRLMTGTAYEIRLKME